jgi:hypothetical protein
MAPFKLRIREAGVYRTVAASRMENQFCMVAPNICFSVWGTPLVAQLVEPLRYKLEGRGIDSRRCYWNFSLT